MTSAEATVITYPIAFSTSPTIVNGFNGNNPSIIASYAIASDFFRVYANNNGIFLYITIGH